MTVIEQALAAGDLAAVQAEGEALKHERIERIQRERADELQFDIIMEFIGRTNPAAIDRMIESQPS